MQNNILIDPSLLVSEIKLNKLLKLVSGDMAVERYYVPASFLKVLYEFELKPNFEVISYFKDREKFIDLHYLPELRYRLERFEGEGKLKKFELKNGQMEEEKYINFFESLKNNTKNDKIARILLEEWVFLQEKSLVISRIKKPFKEFVKAGAICICFEFARRTFDYAASRTVKKDRDLLTSVDRLRAVAKWVAVGSSGILLPDGFPKNLINVGVGFFLLFDP